MAGHIRNVGTLIVSRAGCGKNAKELSKEFYPVFKQTGIAQFSAYDIHLKATITGKTFEAFSSNSLSLLVDYFITYSALSRFFDK